MFLNIKKKYFYYLFLIITGLFIFSCEENLRSEVYVKNRGGYDIINLKVGDTDFHTVKAGTTSSSEIFTPGSYRIKGIFDLPAGEDIEFEKTFQVNVSKLYTIKIRDINSVDADIVITEE